jgi:hypothetical protein
MAKTQAKLLANLREIFPTRAIDELQAAIVDSEGSDLKLQTWISEHLGAQITKPNIFF